MKTVLVIASNRSAHLRAFCEAWSPEPWDETVVVHDGPAEALADGDLALTKTCFQYCWEDVDALGNRGEAFSRCDSGIKSFGFYKAVKERGADVVVTLDDDCLPVNAYERSQFVRRHLESMRAVPRWAPSIPDCFTRGMPYRAAGKREAVVNMGVWSGVGDYDAPQTLALMRDGAPHDSGFHPGTRAPRLLNPLQYVPICGMNLAFRKEVLPLLYFPKMGYGVPYRRFDDIWCGIVLQKACAYLGLGITVGPPTVRHSRASDPFVNLEKEAPGIRANEFFWRVIDRIALAEARSPIECAGVIARALAERPLDTFGMDRFPEELADYLSKLGRWMLDWCVLLGG